MIRILEGNCLDTLKSIKAGSVNTCVTSPPYWGLRDYGTADQLGLEATPEAFVENLVKVFREVRRVLREDGTLWLNLGDSYSGSGKGPAGNLGKAHNAQHMEKKHSAIVPSGMKPKDLVGIPWMTAFALRADGWFLRSDIIWHKPNPMPESVTDRPTKAHEYIFLLTKSPKYFYDAKAIAEPWKENAHDIKRAEEGHEGYAGKHDAGYNGGVRGQPVGDPSEGRNKRTVWTVPTHGYREAHFATFPPDLIEPCILAGSPARGTVLDPFGGAGTTGLVADRHGRDAILCELNPEYVQMMQGRLSQDAGLFANIEVVKPV